METTDPGRCHGGGLNHVHLLPFVFVVKYCDFHAQSNGYSDIKCIKS